MLIYSHTMQSIKLFFRNRKDALKIVKEAENNKPMDISTETDYEEY